MGVEIERKFLVNPTKLLHHIALFGHGERYEIVQGYLSTRDPTVRVRKSVNTRDGKTECTFTVKGHGLMTRTENEVVIDKWREADALLEQCPHVIKKTRYKMMADGHLWEVDIFIDHLAGLILAEVELKAETEEVEMPSFITKEVTNDPRYANSKLAQDGWPKEPDDTDQLVEATRGLLIAVEMLHQPLQLSGTVSPESPGGQCTATHPSGIKVDRYAYLRDAVERVKKLVG